MYRYLPSNTVVTHPAPRNPRFPAAFKRTHRCAGLLLLCSIVLSACAQSAPPAPAAPLKHESRPNTTLRRVIIEFSTQVDAQSMATLGALTRQSRAHDITYLRSLSANAHLYAVTISNDVSNDQLLKALRGTENVRTVELDMKALPQ